VGAQTAESCSGAGALMRVRYDIGQSYDWNFANAPDALPEVEVPACPGRWDFLGIPVNSPLGIPAGPLLNSRWVLYYARLGFDVLVYKTVRSGFRASYDPPNLLPVSATSLLREGTEIDAAPGEPHPHTWAISFGMPSKAPQDWRADVERARRGLGKGQALVVSVVASPQPDWTIGDLARDFAQCAVWAAESGADAVEANLSCPNVCTKEADLYLDAPAAALIAAELRTRVPRLPLALKIGLFRHPDEAEALVEAVGPHVDGLSSANSITAVVRGEFGGMRRGIGGSAITRRCLEEMAMLRGIVERKRSQLRLIGVGGVMTGEDVAARLQAGAHAVHLATAPMLDPEVGLKIRAHMAGLAYP
jgi:dihydroorotate dehydrogenase (NAD+) catalytic subunit